MLEEDAAKFDAFLKDNDAAVQDAQRRADAETAARQVKVRAVSLFLQVPLNYVTNLLKTTRLSTLNQVSTSMAGRSDRSCHDCGRSVS